MAMATKAAAGLCGAALQARPARPAFLGAAPAMPRARMAQATRRVTAMAAPSKEYPSNWLNANPLVLALGFAGWTVPAASPAPAFGGKSLFSLFLASISDNLSHFPVGPQLDDPFWLYFIIYHAGLFLTIFLGQIGYNARRQGYFN